MLLLLDSYLIDAVTPYAKWATIAVIALLLVAFVVVAVARRDILGKFVSVSLNALFVWSLVLGILLLSLDIAKHFDPAYLEENYVDTDVTYLVLIPLAATLTLTLAGGIAVFIVNKKSPDKTKAATVAVCIVCGVAFAISLVTIAIYFSDNISGDGYYTADGTMFNRPALYISAVSLVVVALVAAFLLDREKFSFDSKTIARAGICIAISFALSFVKLFKLPQGGSVTFGALVPVMIFAYMYGIKKGLLVGLVYGLLQSVQDPFIIHPAQFFLDYPIAFTMIGFSGALKNVGGLSRFPRLNFALGATLAVSLRFFAHVLSGVFAFGAYAIDAGQNVLFYSLAYNSFVFVDAAIAVVLGVVILKVVSLRRLFGE